MSAPIPACACCGADGAVVLGKLPDSEWFAGKRLAQPLDGGWLYRCAQCRLKFRYPLASTEMYRALYDNAETTTWPTNATRPDWDLILEQVDAFAPNGGRILDFGCYSGGLLSRLDARHERFGIEVNRHAAQVARQSTGALVWSSVEDIPDDLRFDVVVIADVVEHLPDPRALFDVLEPKLAEGGVIVVSTGDADNPLWNRFDANWWYCFYPEHIAFVSQAWVERALIPRGWSMRHCQRFRYHRFDRTRRMLEFAFACAYGWCPRAYLYILGAIKRWSGREAVTSVPGNGVSADHLLFAVGRKGSP